MKQIIIGDIHGRTTWKKIVETEKDFDRLIFIGDYFDSFDVRGEVQLNNFLDICEYARTVEASSKGEVIMLIGNHDIHYIPKVGYTGTSGYQSRMKVAFGEAITKNEDLLQMCFEDEYNVIYTHAGVGTVWLKEALEWAEHHYGVLIQGNTCSSINQLYKLDPVVFQFNTADFSGYGNHRAQGPVWIRPQALEQVCIDNPQVVGHTGVKKITNLKDLDPTLNIWLIDNLEAGEYLVSIDGEFQVRQQL